MFLFRADRILEELAEHEPAIVKTTEQAFDAAIEGGDGSIETPLAMYEKIPSAPIDKAVMERASRIAVAPCNPDWTDLGSWHSIWEQSARDEQGNATFGDVLLNNVENCLVHTSHRLVACTGIRDLAIIETDDALLVADRHRSEPIKEVVASLNEADRSEAIQHSATEHDWGSTSILEQTASGQVRRLEIAPGKAIDNPDGTDAHLHWLVIEGQAAAQLGDQETSLTIGQSADLSPRKSYSLRNTSESQLTLIEVNRSAARTG